MALQFYKLKVKELKKETSDAVSIRFEIPSEVKHIFNYKHGQYLTLRFFINGKDERRSYSISSCPVIDESPTVTVKAVVGGVVSNYITDKVKVGDEIDVMPPLGNFTIDLNENNDKTYFLIGAGSGVTPLISIIRTILEIEKNSKVYFVYVNRSEDSIIFYQKLIEIKNKFFDRFTLNHVLTQPTPNWPGNKGRLDKNRIIELINKFIPNEKLISEYFLCGPSGLMQESLAALQTLNVNNSKIHKETFIIDLEENKPKKEHTTQDNGNIDSLKVVLYGEEHTIKIAKDETILVAGMRAGIDPPFSCQIGACSTCRAKVISGQVRMEDDDALTEGEIQQGYVLTCTSYPLTNDVLVSYDD